jgi:hypothetical protein
MDAFRRSRRTGDCFHGVAMVVEQPRRRRSPAQAEFTPTVRCATMHRTVPAELGHEEDVWVPTTPERSSPATTGRC